MQKEKSFLEILQEINNQIQVMSLEATGAIGEIVAQIILLKAFDNATDNLEELKTLTVSSFLNSLLLPGLFETIRDKLPKEVLGGLICFNHFIKKYDELTEDDAKIDFTGRAAAGQFKNQTKGYDLFIPVILEDNNLSFILIQVKNSKTISEVDINNKMSKYKSETNFKMPNISILMSLASTAGKEASINVKDDYFICKGLDIYQLKDDVKAILKEILDCDRNPFLNKKFNSEIIREVTHGSYSSNS